MSHIPVIPWLTTLTPALRGPFSQVLLHSPSPAPSAPDTAVNACLFTRVQTSPGYGLLVVLLIATSQEPGMMLGTWEPPPPECLVNTSEKGLQASSSIGGQNSLDLTVTQIWRDKEEAVILPW